MKSHHTILGLNCFHADAAAVGIRDGHLVTGVEEERFARVKHWAGFPIHSISHVLSELGIDDSEKLDAIAVSRKPEAYFYRKVLLAIRNPKSLFRTINRAKNLKDVKNIDSEMLGRFPRHFFPSVVGVEHHLSHIASAFFCSPFEESACLTVDGFGDFVSTMMAVGRGTNIDVIDRVLFPHSLGLFYTALTQYLGFQNFGDEYKVMGMAAYGEPRFVRALGEVIPSVGDGMFRLDLRYFSHLRGGVDMTWASGKPRISNLFTPVLEELLGPRREEEDEVRQFHFDVAASLQQVYEQRFFDLVNAVLRRTGVKRLCLAGGCAMNSLANGKLFNNTDVEDVFIQPAAGDAGTALGAALFLQHAIFGRPRDFVMEHSYWGPRFEQSRIREALIGRIEAYDGQDGRAGDFVVETVKDDARLIQNVSTAIADGEVIGWFQGRSEWGPRALGNRSILADPRRADIRDLLNKKIKRRESFRPFAPAVLEEKVNDWFTIDHPDPFMVKVYPVRLNQRDRIPAVTHVDGTGRLQTVSKVTNPRFWGLIRGFEQITGVPMILNTSFNENEPIVNTPEEAVDCFLRTKMDRMVLEDLMIKRL